VVRAGEELGFGHQPLADVLLGAAGQVVDRFAGQPALFERVGVQAQERDEALGGVRVRQAIEVGRVVGPVLPKLARAAR
jgi:hypothetical protein